MFSLLFPSLPSRTPTCLHRDQCFPSVIVVQWFSLMIVEKIFWDISNKRKQSPEKQTTFCLGMSSPFIKPSRMALSLEPQVVVGSSDAGFILSEVLDTDCIFTRLPVEVNLHENNFSSILQAYGRSCSH